MVRALLVPGPGLKACQDRLARLGVCDQLVAPRGSCADTLAWLARNVSGRTLIVDSSVLAAQAAIGQLVDDPAVANGALVTSSGLGRPDQTPVRVRQRRIVSAGSLTAVRVGPGMPHAEEAWSADCETTALCWGLPVSQGGAVAFIPSVLHEVSAPSAVFLGVLVISDRVAATAREALIQASQAASVLNWVADPVDIALVALVRHQVSMSAVELVGPGIRRGTAQEFEAVNSALANLDERRVLLERANRPDDGFYSTFVLRKLSKPLTSAALRMGLSPNQISVFSLFVGLCAAVSFAVGTWPMLLLGAILLQASLTIDCVDGEVARFTRSFSAFGAWLDAATDRVKEYAAYAGLALGGAIRQGEDLWLLAALVMVMQTIRHIGDYDFSRVQRIRESWVPALPLAEITDGGSGGTGATLAFSAQLNERQGVHWVKKVLHMPIGERWLVISVGAVLLGPKLTFFLLLALGLMAFAYTTTGRILRARRWHHEVQQSGAWLLEPQLDLGPFGEPVWAALFGKRRPLAAQFGWAIPALMRLVEFGVVLLLALALGDWRLYGGLPAWGAAWVYAWLFVVAFHHYDTLYRALGGISPPDWLVWSGLGWDGRTILVLLVSLGGVSYFTAFMQWGSVVMFVLLVVVASVQWVQQMRGREPIDA